MTEPLYRQDLNQMDCDNPLCDSDHDIFLHAKCHPSSSMKVSYNRGIGCMDILCFKCGNMVVRVRVEEATIQ